MNRSVFGLPCCALVMTLLVVLSGAGSGLVSAEPVKITVMRFGGGDALDDEYIAMFNSAHPHIQVEWTSGGNENDHHELLMILAATDDLPELFWVNRSLGQRWYLQRAGYFERLDPYIERDGLDLSRIIPTYFVANRDDDGHIVAFPHYRPGAAYGTWLTIFNRRLFDEAGLAEPEPNWTYDDARVAARMLTQDRSGDGSPDIWGMNIRTGNDFGGRPTHLWMWSNGVPTFTPDERSTNILHPGAIQAFEYALELRDIGVVVPNHLRSQFRMENDNVGIQIFTTGANATSITRNFPHVEWGYAHMPRGPLTERSYVQAGANLMVMSSRIADEAKREAAWEFMKFSFTPEAEAFRLRSDLTPFFQETVQHPSWITSDRPPYDMRPLMTQAFWVLPFHVPGFQRAAEDALITALRPVWAGDQALVPALEAASPIIDSILREEREHAGF